ncbi:hypothetical protein MKY14_04020 [Paenibacillus sp. FSL R5-0887]|uniref:hypothetical protein n=1 Tax=Paenibacillus TaxID=44249 RepID=UPI00096CB895|nr:hypothetical protein [Paenibacillus odorifer]OMD60999.1 hypothetical protein BSK55_06560 [Paenibacillus odorifer]
MSDRKNEYTELVKSLKQSLTSSEEVACIRLDLVGTGLKPERYSDDMFLYRDEDDKFIYIHDNEDETSGKLDLNSLKIILDNIAKRWIDEKYEREELEKFLNSEEVE